MSARAPAYSLIVDGRDLTPTVEARLSSLTLTEKRGDEADQLDLVLTDHDGRLALPRRGAIIALALGWRGKTLTGKGRFKVDELEWTTSPGELHIRGRSTDFTGDLRTRRERSWRGVTLRQVLRDLAAANGLGLKVSDELAAASIEVLAQSRESDLALLQKLGKTYDAVAAVKAGTLIFTAKAAGKTATGKPLGVLDIAMADGDQVSWKVAERGTYTGVTASWHDTAAGKRQRVQAGAKKGARSLRKTFASKADAERAAASEWKRIQRGEATMSYTLALGRPDVFPERKVKFSGVKPQIDQTSWVITQATHSLSNSGFTTAFELETAG